MLSRQRPEERRENKDCQGTWIVRARREGSPEGALNSAGTQVYTRVLYSVFYLFLDKNIFPDREQDTREMIQKLEATCWRLLEYILVRELTATHRLERMRRLQMLVEQKAWKREAGFDRIEITAEICAQHLHAGFDSETLYNGLYNPRWPHSPEEHKLEMDVDVEQLRLEILLSQPAPSRQDYLSPRRSPAVGTGLHEFGVLRADMQITKQKGNFPLQATVDGFLHVSCTSPEQGTTFLLQADVGVDAETTTTKAQVAAREEFARLPIGRQQRGTTSTEKNKQFDPGG